MKSIKIDVNELRKWVKETGLTQAEISRSLGGSISIIGNAIQRGHISEPFFQLLILKYGINPERLKFKELVPKTVSAVQPGKGYATSVVVYPDKVRFAVAFDGDEIYHTYSRIKGKKEVDLIQAISYAAHMCYKQAEQKELEG